MDMKQKGKFIVFEGIDGAGKTTQIDLLEARLRSDGRTVFRTAEPTESVTGGLLRDALAGVSKRSPCELAALFTLDRIYHNVNPVNGIRKMLDSGVDVICDRYYYSTLAYQGSETDFNWVRSLNLDCPEITRPDLCVFLDLTPEQSMRRITQNRLTTEIFETAEKLAAVRDRFFFAFNALQSTDRVRIVNADRPRETIADEIYEIIKYV